MVIVGTGQSYYLEGKSELFVETCSILECFDSLVYSDELPAESLAALKAESPMKEVLAVWAVEAVLLSEVFCGEIFSYLCVSKSAEFLPLVF